MRKFSVRWWVTDSSAKLDAAIEVVEKPWRLAEAEESARNAWKLRATVFAIGNLPDGVRVRKPDATPFDFAYRRIGSIVRERIEEKNCIGVLWDGGVHVYEYSSEQLMEIATSSPETS